MGDGRMNVVLGVVDLGGSCGSVQEQAARLARSAAKKLYILMVRASDSEDAGALTPAALNDLLGLFEGVASVDPRLYTVPLLPWAGWTPERMAALDDVEGFVQASMERGQQEGEGHDGSGDIVAAEGAGGPAGSVTSERGVIRLPGAAGDQRRGVLLRLLQQATGVASDTPAAQGSGEVLRYSHVAMGGTFDRLHCGHMLLLAVAALAAEKKLYIGITADALLAKKAHHELLQPYDERAAQSVEYLQLVRPGLDVQTGPLRDPQEPTAAELQPEMQAIVVSEETVPGAVDINKGRSKRGYAPLQMVVVKLVGLHKPGGGASAKLGSTELRALEAARRAKQAAA